MYATSNCPVCGNLHEVGDKVVIAITTMVDYTRDHSWSTKPSIKVKLPSPNNLKVSYCDTCFAQMEGSSWQD